MDLKRLLLIAYKDLKLIFRDRAALTLMLLTPFLLTLGMGALTGGFSKETSSTLSDIPVEIINHDQDLLGNALVEVFQSSELKGLVLPQVHDDLSAAKTLVNADKTAAVIYVPAGFTQSLTSGSQQNPLQIELYANPTRAYSVGVLRSIVDQFLNQVEIGRIAGEVVVTQLLQNGLIVPEQAVQVGQSVGKEVGAASFGASSIKLNIETAEDEALKFNILAYLAPGMATMFLMFTVTYGAQSLLVENRLGTLQRMLVAPALASSILGGKFAGIFFTAVAQLSILIGGTTLLFRLNWGDTLGVILLILAASVAATGWGVFFAAIFKTPGQIGVTGSAIMLIFGLLGGSFFDLSMLPDWILAITKISPNSWANSGFLILSLGGKLKNITTNLLALLVMGVTLFTIASFLIKKRKLI